MPDALQVALDLLTRREHSAHELTDKLTRRGFAEDDIISALAECQRLGYQSDKRYTDSYCRMRIRQGDGPLKIEHFLRLKGVPEALIRERLDEEHWMDHAYRVWQKKFGSARDTSSLAEKAKQQRFMQTRGFPIQLIYELYKYES